MKADTSSPLISILCVSMNHETFIKRSFQSLVNQTYKNVEIIYVDNNSTDKTYEIADEILKASGLPYRGFKRSENYSITDNMNYIATFITGDYIASLSGDDFWEPENLERKIRYFLQHPEYGMIYGGGYTYFYQTGKKLLMNTSRFRSGWIFSQLLKGNFINAVGFMLKTETLKSVGFYDKTALFEDWDLWLRIAERHQIGFLPDPLVYYGIKHGQNISGNIDYLNKGYDHILKKYGHLPEIEHTKEYIRKVNISHEAINKPTTKTIVNILRNFKPEFFYTKELARTSINLLRKPFKRK